MVLCQWSELTGVECDKPAEIKLPVKGMSGTNYVPVCAGHYNEYTADQVRRAAN